MYRQLFYLLTPLSLALIAVLSIFWLPALWLLIIWLPLALIGLHDLRCPTNVLNNYPVIGHLRYMLEFVRPELRQYFFESETSGRPFSREKRNLINARADGGSDTSPFGTIRDVEAPGYNFSGHSIQPGEVSEENRRIVVGGPQCRRPYNASRLNISAMSFGSLSGSAVEAMNQGARMGGFAHDTGEGAISPYHEKHGGDLIWELGTAYFGCRTKEGRFDPDTFRDKAQGDQVKMIEIKISQGAKPSHGGLLPAAKVNEEIAQTRQIEAGQDCPSPASHPEFSNPREMLEFVTRLRELSDGKPVGIKLCIGKRSEFLSICRAMVETGTLVDFITVDGAEGGTGAAPQEFSDSLGAYIDEALPFVDNALRGTGLRQHIRLIASGKVALGYDMVVKTALGADMCNAARAFMFAVGCIQARRCHTNRCPTGVTTQDPKRARAVHVPTKAERVRQYHKATLDSFAALTGAMGLSRFEDLSAEHIQHRSEYAPSQPASRFSWPALSDGQLLGDEIPAPWQECWQAAGVDRF
ncbi:FMN-binding glutamate synthase family protein [Kushneria phosphatilytica]|uniref:FMN-binding glutamate synthase family protein n=1 Tax=Kushneria phosphatilytica TaxID=657387 RepID=A0A5C1A0Z9_9GAMM|nr:FMN-binding glutamate synthase family protein [Kushneria phosphatilytica]QEL11363.1 FMN-binding glutamate synthase family protein [Kushneria phosphatilytica]